MEIYHFTFSSLNINKFDFTDIRYWRVPFFSSRADDRVKGFFLCVDGESTIKRYGVCDDGTDGVMEVSYLETRTKVVGVLAYVLMPDNTFELDYVSVRPEYQGKGISRALTLKFCELMRDISKKPFLVRSRPGAVAPSQFTKKMDDLFTKEGINWEQTRYVETSDKEGVLHNTLAKITRTLHSLSVCTSVY
jgi:predicted GNAT family acetyltransferase